MRPEQNGRERESAPPAFHKARILVADDHPLIRFSLRNVIDSQRDMEVCGEVSSASEIMDAVAQNKPDLMLLDVSLGDANGLEIIVTILREHPLQRILVLSVHDEQFYARRALCAGALGYVMKSEPVDAVLAAIRVVLSGEVYISGVAKDRLLQHLVGFGRGEHRVDVDRLTDRELHVFELMGRGKTTREIAEALHLSSKTIETHRLHIKAKLGASSSTELTCRAVQWIETDGAFAALRRVDALAASSEE